MSPRRPHAPRKPESRPALVAHIDGGARGNPGPAGYGVHIEAEGGGLVAEIYGFLGVATNNTAEYAALLALLEYALKEGAASLRVLSDSQLLVRQLQGQYKVKDPKLKILVAEARRLISGLQRCSFEHVPREENKKADALANRAMDEQASTAPMPRALQKVLPHSPEQTKLF